MEEPPEVLLTGSTALVRDSIEEVGGLSECLFVSVCSAELTFSLQEIK